MQLSSTCVAAAALLIASAAVAFAGPGQGTHFPGGVIIGPGYGAPAHVGHGVRHAAPRAPAFGHRAPSGYGHRFGAWRAPPAVHGRAAHGWTRLHPPPGWNRHARHAPRPAPYLVSGGGTDASLLRSFAEPPLAPTAHYVVSIAPQVIYVGAPPRHAPNVRVVSGTPGVRAQPDPRRNGVWRDPNGTVWQEY